MGRQFRNHPFLPQNCLIILHFTISAVAAMSWGGAVYILGGVSSFTRLFLNWPNGREIK